MKRKYSAESNGKSRLFRKKTVCGLKDSIQLPKFAFEPAVLFWHAPIDTRADRFLEKQLRNQVKIARYTAERVYATEDEH
jgi:hypothetical protein